MRWLVACEEYARVRDALVERGHDAYSCDLKPSRRPSNRHIQGPVEHVLDEGWDALIAFPPCTYLCSSGLFRNKNNPERQRKTEAALQFVELLLGADVPMIALENPVGCISTRIREPDQFIQPYEYGHDASKTTCLWLKGFPPLKPTLFVPPRLAPSKCGRRQLFRWANQTDSGQNKLTPGDDRAEIRGITYMGIAEAMADQWGSALKETA